MVEIISLRLGPMSVVEQLPNLGIKLLDCRGAPADRVNKVLLASHLYVMQQRGIYLLNVSLALPLQLAAPSALSAAPCAGGCQQRKAYNPWCHGE